MQEPSAGRTLRIAGTLLVIAGAVGFLVVMFFLGGVSSSLRVMVPGAAAALGLYLLQKASTGVRRQETIRQNALALLTVFFTFGTIGPLLMFVFEADNIGPAPAVLAIFVSGSIATLWASAFIFRAFWLLPLTVAYQVFAPEPLFIAADRMGLMQNFGDLAPRTRAGATAALAVLSLIAGYIVFVIYVRRVERSSARAKAELATAAQIHESLTRPVHAAGPGAPLTVCGTSIASSEMGGDLVECVHDPATGDLYAIVADVSGHGVRAGVVMGVFKGALRERLADKPTPADLFAAVNRTICALTDDDIFVTAACLHATKDPAAPGGTRITVALAGHMPPIIAAPSGSTRDATDAGGLPLGVVPDERYEDMVVQMHPGETMLLYTDGLSETRGRDGRLLGHSGIAAMLAEAAARGDTSTTMLDDLMRAIARTGPQEDDRSALLATLPCNT